MNKTKILGANLLVILFIGNYLSCKQIAAYCDDNDNISTTKNIAQLVFIIVIKR